MVSAKKLTVRSKMKGINRTGAPLVHVPGWVDGWVGGWMDGWIEVKAVLRIAYSNQKNFFIGVIFAYFVNIS
jgi:hypothetical protein